MAGNTVNSQINIFLNVVNNVTKPLNEAKKSLEKINTQLKDMQGRLLSGGLAFLFTGMAIKRFFGTALRGIINTYTQIIDVNDQFFQRTQQLRAAWEFFKFSLMDALGQSNLFVAIVDFIIGLVNWFGRLSPNVKEALGFIIIFGLMAGVAMGFLGATLLFVNGLAGLLGVSFGVVSFWLLIIFGVIGFIVAQFIIWNGEMNTFDKVAASSLLTVGSALVLIGLKGEKIVKIFKQIRTVGLTTWLATLNPVTIILVLLGALLIIFALLIVKYGGVTNAAIQFGITTAMFLAFIGDAFIEFLIFPIRTFITLVDLAIKLYNRITGKKLPSIGNQLEDLGLGKGMFTRKVAEVLAPFEPGAVKNKSLGEEFDTSSLVNKQMVNMDLLQTNLLKDMNNQQSNLMKEQNELISQMKDDQKNLLGDTIKQMEDIKNNFVPISTTTQ